MKYNIYDTDALVLKTQPLGENGKTALLFTREFGCLYARVQGVRKQASKTRSGVVESNLVTAGLLFGKGGWRITYIIPRNNFYFLLREEPWKQRMLFNIIAVCGHLIGESVESQGLFDSIIKGLADISEKKISYAQVCDLERFIMLRTLHSLGYVEHEIYNRFVSDEFFCKTELMEKPVFFRRQITKEINKALEVAW